MRDEHDDLEASTERAWTEFRQRLADRLAGSGEEGDVLVVEVETGVADDELLARAPYAEFVAFGDGTVRGEVASNTYLDERYALTADDERLLLEMGWRPPSYDEDGDPVPGQEDFHLEAPQREADRMAVMTVRALREVFGCPHPAFLEAEGLERSRGAAAEPIPGQWSRPRSATRTTSTTCSRWWTMRSR